MPSDFDLNVPIEDDEDDCLVVEIFDEDPLEQAQIEGDTRQVDADNIVTEIPDLNLEYQPDTNQVDQTHQCHQSANDHQHSRQHTRENTNHHKTRRLSIDDKLGIVAWLLDKKIGSILPHGSIKAAAIEFNLNRKTISRVWKQAQQQRTATGRYECMTKYHNCGRKRIQVDEEALTNLTMGLRTCIRDLAERLKISPTTCWRMVKRGIIKPHTNALHPGLKDANKIERLVWILRLLMGETWEDKEKYFPMYDFVHLDEKWFYLTRKSQRVYLHKNEKGQYRAAQSSKFIPKVMFTAVLGRPHYNSEGELLWDGKVGIFPFVYYESAKRNSKNRKKGTCVTKVVESVNKKVTRDVLIHEVIPAIKAKWPKNAPKVIQIQQDNARTHITQDDPEWQKVYQQDGFTFILRQQPPNSPDLNILDLGFFRSIQSLMHKKMPKNVDEMIVAVEEAFNELDVKTLRNVWITLQYVMNEILKLKGSNDFNLPHVNKQRLEAQGLLEMQIKAPVWAVKECWDIVNAAYDEASGESHNEGTEIQYNTQDQVMEEDNHFFDEDWEMATPFGEGTSNGTK